MLLLVVNTNVYPGEVNQLLALIGGIGCAAALDRGPRADAFLAGCLLFSLGSAAGGLAVGAACVVHVVCTRAPLRRWFAVLGPLALWALWFLTINDAERPDPGESALDTGEKVEVVRELAWAAFDRVGLGFGPLAALLFVAALAWAVWQLRQGLAAGANVLAWTMALAVWTIGLAESRGTFAEGEPYRYVQTAMAYVLLAIVPREPIRWPFGLSSIRERRVLAVAGCVLLVAGLVRIPSWRSDIEGETEFSRNVSRPNRSTALVVGLGPEVVPNDTELGFTFGLIDAGELRTLLDVYGAEEGNADTIDQRLVEIGAVNTRPNGPRQAAGCKPLTDPVELPTRRQQIVLWKPDGSFKVEVRRFGEEWVPVAEWTNREALAISLPALRSDQPWQVRATGACSVAPAAFTESS